MSGLVDFAAPEYNRGLFGSYVTRIDGWLRAGVKAGVELRNQASTWRGSAPFALSARDLVALRSPDWPECA